MAGRNKQVLFNTLEEPLTSDFNRIGQLAGKAVMDMARRGSSPFGGTPRDAVRSGLEATIAGVGTLPVTISAGELLRYNSGINPITSDASDYEIGTLAASTVVPAATAADATNPRIDVIYATMSDLDSDGTNRNQLILPARTIAPATLNKTRRGSLTLARVEGTPAAAPLFPTVPVGGIALWGVYVRPAEVAILDDHLMDMRVYWTSWALQQELCGVQSGLRVSRGISSTTCIYEIGLGYTSGAIIRNTLDRQFNMSAVVSAGESFAADRQYDFYIVTKGNGVPVGKTVPDGIIPVATGFGNTNPPTVEGRPSPALNFAPLAHAAANGIAATVLALATDRAQYLGTLQSDTGGASFTPTREYDGGPPLDRRGRVFSHATDLVDGRFPGRHGWIRRGKMEWNSVADCFLNVGANGVIDGTPFTLESALTFTVVGSFPSTWLYLYVRKEYSNRSGTRRGPIRTVVPIVSDEAPNTKGEKPTPAAGFTSAEYLYVGPIYNDAANNITRFVQVGDEYRFYEGIELHNADVATAPSISAIQSIKPATSRMVKVAIQITSTASVAGTFDISIYAASALGLAPFFGLEALEGNGTLIISNNLGELAVPTSAGGLFDMNRSAFSGSGETIIARVVQTGIVEDVGQLYS